MEEKNIQNTGVSRHHGGLYLASYCLYSPPETPRTINTAYVVSRALNGCPQLGNHWVSRDAIVFVSSLAPEFGKKRQNTGVSRHHGGLYSGHPLFWNPPHHQPHCNVHMGVLNLLGPHVCRETPKSLSDNGCNFSSNPNWTEKTQNSGISRHHGALYWNPPDHHLHCIIGGFQWVSWIGLPYVSREARISLWQRMINFFPVQPFYIMRIFEYLYIYIY